MTDLLRIEKLSKSYAETRALIDLDLIVDAGSVHAIFGENGSGKSTLVKVLSGIVHADQGQVLLSGIPVRASHPHQMAAIGIVSVFQEVLVSPNRSVLENIFAGTDDLFRRRVGHRERVRQAVALLPRLTTAMIPLEALVETLPLPQQQIIVIARALVRQPRILILDEATAALDIEDRTLLFAELRQRVHDGCAVLFISHRIDEILAIADRVTVLREGRKIRTVDCAGLNAAQLVRLVLPVANEVNHVAH